MNGKHLIAIAACAALLGWTGRNSDPVKYWIFFKDKNVADAGTATNRLTRSLSPAVQARWARAGWRGDEGDLPVASEYVREIRGMGVQVLRESRWLNAVSARLTEGQAEALKRSDLVRGIQPVATFRRPGERGETPEEHLDDSTRSSSIHRLDYGPSLHQSEMLQIPSLHDLGYSGKGVVICMMDGGFKKDHEVFRNVRILDEWDFVFNDNQTQWQPDEGPNPDFHGTATWSLVGGRADGRLIGGAFDAGFLLAKTEDSRSETIVEEDNWVAALEWADKRGADIVSSSLGYVEWYTPADFDGKTALVSIAASAAAKRGILVVNSVGNSGGGSLTLITPADAFGILAVGAVNPSGSIASFSSRGPTADGRIKPEVAAPGVKVLVAGMRSDFYWRGEGTSLSAPVVAGAASALLSARRDWSPAQLREAIMQTATRATSPDNDYGWGIPRILDAYHYLPRNAVEIDHTPLRDQRGTAAHYPVKADIRAYWGLDAEQIYVYYRTSKGEHFEAVAMTKDGATKYIANIPAQPAGSTISYYLQATDTKGTTRRRPYTAPSVFYSFSITPGSPEQTDETGARR